MNGIRADALVDISRTESGPQSTKASAPRFLTVDDSPNLAETLTPNPLPAASNGFVTFGCLNNFCKTNEPTFDLWSQVLRAVDRSRLVLLCPEGSHRQHTLDFFQSRGIAPDRLRFLAPCPHPAYLQFYHQIDIVLDTLPYNGHTTSLDALWMGVPIVTLVGTTVTGRATFSQLMNLAPAGEKSAADAADLRQLITHTPESFLTTATQLAHDLPRLAHLRATLRPRMQKSPLMNPPAFTRALESALRQMWHTWCATPLQNP